MASSMRNRPERWWWVLALLPVLYYGITVVRYAYNFPYMDDYLVLVDFLARLPDASLAERWQLLLEQNNFHRVVWVKAVAWAYYALTGKVNFTFLQLLGNSALLLTGFLLVRISNSQSLNFKFEIRNNLPALFLLFQFQSWNNAYWAMAAMSNFWAPAWALLAFYLTFHQHRLSWGIAIGLVAMLTNGNGILVLPLLVVGLFFQQQYRQGLITLLIMIPVFLFYFAGYHNPSGVTLGDLLTPSRIIHLLVLDTAFLGAMFYHPAVSWLSQVVGWVTIAWTVYLLVIRYDRQRPALCWMLVFLHLTGLMLAANRIENSLEIVFASRYRNISALMLATTYLTIVDVVVRKQIPFQRWLVAGALLVAMALNIVSNVTYQSKIERFRELKQTDQLLWQRYGQIRACSPIYTPVQNLNRLAEKGIFNPGPIQFEEVTSRQISLTVPQVNNGQVAYELDINRLDGGYLVVSGWANIEGQKANFNDTYLGVQVGGQWQFFKTLFHQRLDKDNATDKDTGFTAVIPLAVLPIAAHAPLGLYVRSGKKVAFQLLPPKKL